MPKAFICGCAGLALNVEERAFLREEDPWGLILFKRNVADREQMRDVWKLIDWLGDSLAELRPRSREKTVKQA